MVKSRAGKGALGSILTIVFVAAVSYFGWTIGSKYWGFYQFQDRMRQEARFAAHRSDILIKKRLQTYADSLRLPEAARKVSVRRRAGTIHIWA